MLSFHLLQNINWRSEVSSVFSSECSLKEKALVSTWNRPIFNVGLFLVCAPLFRTDVVCRFTSVILTLVQINAIYSMIDKNSLSAVLFPRVFGCRSF